MFLPNNQNTISHISSTTGCVSAGLHFRSILEVYTKPRWTILLKVSIAVMKHYDQKRVKEERIYWLTLPHHTPSHHHRTLGQELKQGRDLEAGTDKEAMEKSAYFPRDGTLTMSWALPHRSMIKKVSIDLLIVVSSGDIFSNEVPSFQMILACVKLT